MLIGKKAPEFTCQAIINNTIQEISLQQFNNNYKVLFFYPLDFTFVCPTELHAFQEALPEFQERNAVILGISIDSVYSHQAWLNQPKEQGGIAGIEYYLLSDLTKEIARAYEVLNEETGTAYRGLFIIDKNNIVQVVQINNESLGRNIDEVVRLLDAVQFVEKHGQVCPANWTKGQAGLEPDTQGVRDYFKSK